MNRVLVFTATYNEADNIPWLVSEVFDRLPDCDMLVVDDNSPDGTGRILEELRAKYPRLHLVHRPGKNGLGTAHKLAMKYAMDHGYDALITMDADFSHNPSYLPIIVRKLEDSDFVIGSRYVRGGSCEYPPSRILLSRTANSLTRALLGIPLHETTTSYRGFRRSLLERMNIDAIRSDGYSFFVEAIYEVARLTAGDPKGMSEFPIRFADRRAGTTKISKKEIWKGFTTLGRLAVQRVAAPVLPKKPPPTQARSECNLCGCTYSTEEFAASNEGHASPSYRCTSTGHESHGRIVQCLGCRLVYTSPQLPSDEVLSLYSAVEDQTYLDNIDARIRTFSSNFISIKPYLPPRGRLLDLGSYCGTFLQIARDDGYDVLGVEPSVWASGYAQSKLGIPTVTGHIRDVPRDKPFDIICSWDVLEHVSDPMTELKLINERLRMGGVLAFSTLDYGNWYPKLMGERWPWLMDMHLYYFDQKVMKEMLRRAGFKVLHHQPYCHVITFEYFLRKLGALGIPGAETVRHLVDKTRARDFYLTFRFGDIQLFVCEKIAEADASKTAEGPRSKPRAVNGGRALDFSA